MKQNSYTPKPQGFIFLIVAILSLFISCGATDLKSENYWNGSEKEASWVKDNLPAQVKTKANESDSKTERYIVDIPEPRIGENGKFRIAVVVSGEYWEFADNLKGLIQGFSTIEWANPVAFPPSITTTDQMFLWLSTQDYSDWIEFVPELYCNLAWGDNMGEAEALFNKGKPDADIIIAYGGMAAKFFYQFETYPVAVIADAVTDPIQAGITLTPEDSGKDFFSSKTDTEQFRKQIRLFHEITQFKTLGIVYGDDEYGLIYGAVRDVEAVAKELDFQIIRNTNVKEDMADDTVELYLAALKDVASRSDAVYIGASTAVTEYDILDDIVAILDEAGVPSFSLEGSIRVKNGIMLSLASSATIRSGIYTATKMTQALCGTLPRVLTQKFESVPSVAVNLATAAKIGYQVPSEVIINSDEVYITRDGSSPAQSLRSKMDGNILMDFASVTGQTASLMEGQKRSDGNKWKIGIVLSGSYWEFDQHFRGMLEGFASIGWAEADYLGVDTEKTVEQLLASLDGYSEFLEFPKEYVFNLEWGENTAGVKKLFGVQKPDIDLLIVFGGVAGKLFSKHKEYPIPVLMEGITDPIGSGIIYSHEDSGMNYVTCRVDPGQYQRQVQLFHDFIGFKKLGIIYGDDEYGRLYGAVHDVELVARKRGITIVRKTAVRERVSKETVPLYLAALRDICDEVDAVYLGASTALTEYNITSEVTAILEKAQLPSFALEGEIRVKEGVMLGVSSLESEKFGLYNAKKIITIFSGISPRSLPQIMEGVPSIALNMRTARKIGRDIPLSVLSSIDKIYY